MRTSITASPGFHCLLIFFSLFLQLLLSRFLLHTTFPLLLDSASASVQVYSSTSPLLSYLL